MHWIDYLIVIIPVISVLWFAFYSKRYVRGVVDYLAAGRVAGRYVLTVGDMTAGLGVITLVALVEANYQTGFALGFWNAIMAPVAVLMSLTGYCAYRFRETKSLSNGQFLEMRYNRSFRLFASFLRILAEMLTNAIGPAIAANFFIYFLGLPHTFEFLGFTVSTFAAIVGLVLLFALVIILPGGRLSLIITDSFQGLICYPFFVIISLYIMFTFSWGNEIVPVMIDRVPGESFINPFDIDKLRDFNLFALVVTIFGAVLNRGGYMGNDSSSAGRNPHEQKMAGVLSSWRAGFSGVMCMFVAIAIITVMTHKNFSGEAHTIRQELANKVVDEAVPAELRARVHQEIEQIAPAVQQIGVDAPLSQAKNLDTPYMDAAQRALAQEEDGNVIFQQYRTLYHQMMMPMGLRRMLPVGIMGGFCLLMILLMVTTDDGRIFNAASAIIQDLVIPLRKTPLSPEQHVRWIKWCNVFVALFFFAGSLLFAQLDYINMFLVIMVSIWLGGAGPVIIFGLYSRFGNTVGAFSAIISGASITIAGIFAQRNWAETIYPLLERQGWVTPLAQILDAVSSPFTPYIVWTMDPVKFPINSYEIYFIAMIVSIIAYVVGSLVTYRGPYNLERLLHRGEYNVDHDEKEIASAWTFRNVWGKLIGITPEYTKGDKVIAWSVFIWTFVYQIGLCFVAVLIWNMVSPWPTSWWGHYTYVTSLLIATIVSLVTTVWFLWGGTVDTIRLFKDLKGRVNNPLDNGMVSGHVSLADEAIMGEKAMDDNPAEEPRK